MLRGLNLLFASKNCTIVVIKAGKVMLRIGQPKMYALMVVIAILFILITGCIKTHFHRSNQVADTFEQYQMLADHKYYFFGRKHSPDAIVGILNGWTFQTTKWKVVENEETFREIVGRILGIAGIEFNILPNGAYIRNAQGENIGIWFSAWETPVLRFTDDTTFTISDPIPTFPHGNTGGNGEGRFRSGS